MAKAEVPRQSMPRVSQGGQCGWSRDEGRYLRQILHAVAGAEVPKV